MSEAERPVSTRRKRRWFFRAVIGCCGLFLLAGLGFLVAVVFFQDRPEVPVPDVVGLDEATARTRLIPLQLEVESVRGYQPDAPEGTVVRQEPPAGSRVRIGRRILLHLSSGAPPVVVPDVVGLPLLEARNRLDLAGLASFGRGGGFGIEVKAEVADDSRLPGTVLEQDPGAGSLLAPGDTVWVVVSTGPRGFGRFLPDLRGVGLAKAEALLDTLGVRAIEAVEVPVDERSHGLVVGQTPPPGTPVTEVEVVRLEVGVGVAAEQERQTTIVYAVPAGDAMQEVLIAVEDARGVREAYRGKPKPGTQISVPVKVVGGAWARLYVGGALKDGWPL